MAAVAGAVDATIDKVLDQAFAKSHERWLANEDRANAGDQFLAEETRLGFSGAAARQGDLAAGILGHRAVEAQPQSPGGAGRPGVPGQLPGT